MTSTLTYNNDDLEFSYNGREYSVDVHATAEQYYSPGCMYRRNGDPGDPPEYDFEITDIDATWSDITEEEPYEVEPDDGMKQYLADLLNDMPESFE